MVLYRVRPDHLGRDGAVRTLDPALRKAGMEYCLDRRGWRAGTRAHLGVMGAAVLPVVAFRARVRSRAAPAAAAPAHRGTHVGPLSDAPARNGGGISPQSRCVYHRMDRCPHDPGDRRQVRSRRLHRLRHFNAALTRRRRARACGLSAVRPGARRDRRHGSNRRSLCAAFHGVDGWSH